MVNEIRRRVMIEQRCSAFFIAPITRVEGAGGLVRVSSPQAMEDAMTGSAGRFCTAGLVSAVFALSAAGAADLPASMFTKAPPRPPAGNWTGFYGGVNVGGSSGHQRTSLVDATTGARLLSNSLGLNGVIGGGQAGYNWQPYGSRLVFGVEADIQGSGQKAAGSFAVAGLTTPGIVGLPGDNVVSQDKLDWFGTLRGRIGWAMGERSNWLPYITGGFAYGQGTISSTGTAGGLPVAFNNTNTYAGWVLGGGVEWAFWDRWSAKAEYLYVDLGRGPVIPLTPTLNVNGGRMTDNIGRLGVNYHF
jgi:outer membrane immunogenic protein